MPGIARSYLVDITLTADQLERFYAGHVNQVSARDTSGLRLQFPLQSLRPYVNHAGVQGRFRLEVGPDHRLSRIVKIQ